MAFISQEEINEIRAKANIVEIISDYVSLTQKGKNYFGVCPFHSDHSPSMSVSPDKQIYKCFSCGASGNVFTFVQEYENVDFAESVIIVADKISYSLKNYTSTKKIDKFYNDYKIVDLAWKFYQNNINSSFGNTAKKYLSDRGITENEINSFGIGLSLDQSDSLYKFLKSKSFTVQDMIKTGLCNQNEDRVYDLFSRRIMIPIFNADGKPVGFTARIYRGEKDTAKYVNTKATDIFVKGNLLFNLNNAKDEIKKTKQIIIVEGHMDAIRLYSNGVKNVVALMGTSMTKDHLGILAKLKAKVILCLDNDNAGEEATINNGDMLTSNNIETEVIRITDVKDVDEYIFKFGIDKFNNNINNPIKYFDYKMFYLKKNKDLNNTEELAKYINSVIDGLQNTSDDILKELTIQKLSIEYGVNIDTLRNKISINKININRLDSKNTDNIMKKKNKYVDAGEKLLYFMMNDKKYINLCNKNIKYFPIKEHREICNEISCYYEMNKMINLADFISFVANKHCKELVMKIVSECNDDIIDDKKFYDYIKVINTYIIETEIRELKKEQREELDINKKIEIGNKITRLKKEV